MVGRYQEVAAQVNLMADIGTTEVMPPTIVHESVSYSTQSRLVPLPWESQFDAMQEHVDTWRAEQVSHVGLMLLHTISLALRMSLVEALELAHQGPEKLEME